MTRDGVDFLPGSLGDLGLRVFTTFITLPGMVGSPIRIPRFTDHWRRVSESALSLHIINHARAEQYKNWVDEHLATELKAYQARSGNSQLRLRLVLGAEFLDLFVDPFLREAKLDAGVKVLSYPGERALPTHKTTSAALSVIARRAAEAQGSYEALLIDRDGYVREGAWSNLFWFDRFGVLSTIGERVLPGIVRQIILEHWDCRRCEISLTDLKREAREVFITQSTNGIIPVVSIDDTPVSNGTPGILTSQLSSRFLALFVDSTVPV